MLYAKIICGNFLNVLMKLYISMNTYTIRSQINTNVENDLDSHVRQLQIISSILHYGEIANVIFMQFAVVLLIVLVTKCSLKKYELWHFLYMPEVSSGINNRRICQVFLEICDKPLKIECSGDFCPYSIVIKFILSQCTIQVVLRFASQLLKVSLRTSPRPL